ncbi:hypothetical protein CTAYLR_005493 [Chrysophaeum taylorii]|uniref:Macro domain-containing protein n=1 Tax=Chrysophaeum taylorii TaxID=2483200 RepID=A0AAD7XGC7_9STRA|nr:hypothetical protein CTAYLR_005493 [Chrysophaeum taylorii]
MQALAGRARRGFCEVEVWTTPCIVSSPPPRADALVVSANERLCGTQFAYFNVGGPTPLGANFGAAALGFLKTMRVEERALYPCESVDGLVTEYGGTELARILEAIPSISDDLEYPVRCPTGGARRTPAGPLATLFPAGLVHAVPPFWGNDWDRLVASAYRNAFAAAFADAPASVLAVPLLGAGARGAPLPDAARAAARAAGAWLASAADGPRSRTVAFSVLSDRAAEMLASAIINNNDDDNGAAEKYGKYHAR